MKFLVVNPIIAQISPNKFIVGGTVKLAAQNINQRKMLLKEDNLWPPPPPPGGEDVCSLILISQNLIQCPEFAPPTLNNLTRFLFLFHLFSDPRIKPGHK